MVSSKGKSATVAAATGALHAAGVRVGTITSPPHRHKRERVRIAGTAVSEAEYGRLSEPAAQTLEKMPALNLFDGYLAPSGLLTLCGVPYLLVKGVEALVIEEGLGGASDEVSHFDYPAVAVTQIFAKHADILGGSLEGWPRTSWASSQQRPEKSLHLRRSQLTPAVCWGAPELSSRGLRTPATSR